MNIFFLDQVPSKCAQLHCDKHVVKMILETAQLLSTAHRILDGKEVVGKSASGRNQKQWKLPDDRDGVMYKATHINHPSAVWVRKNTATYIWTWSLFKALCDEYTYRYNKVHKCASMLSAFECFPTNLPFGNFSQPPACMGGYEHCIVEGDSVESYRRYYRAAKSNMSKWTDRPVPEFMTLYSHYKYLDQIIEEANAQVEEEPVTLIDSASLQGFSPGELEMVAAGTGVGKSVYSGTSPYFLVDSDLGDISDLS